MRKVRRSHTKSRKGCVQCKNGHVKCDEVMPTCGLCLKRKQECTWPSGSGNDTHSQESSTPKDGSDAHIGTSESPSSFASDHIRCLEMRLFHHYMVETYRSMPEGRLTHYHYQVIIPKFAANHAFLLDAMLALSAMHLAFSETNETRYWLELGLKYQTSACTSLSRLLTVDVTPEYFGPAFLSSVFIMLTATAYPSVSRDNIAFNALSQVLEMRRLLAGCSLLMERLRNSPSPEMMQWFNVQGSVRKDDSPRENALSDSLQRLYPLIESCSDFRRSPYKNTWDLLSDSVHSWPMYGARGGFIALPIHVSDSFLTLLQEDDWMARILFLHYGVGLQLLSDRWYVGDWGQRMVASIVESMESEIPPEWVSVVTWARMAVGLDATVP
ncbi:uncharacterized protein EURHEDRAFT_455017 [Aspergillus ruber CBS 135680]|uniref:Zn(2)-C6 fungal-type domain-containing protein n=1 Tax=Aspergillus ruber (strain CBS 135680) TaxID=1388766 RepID=A0A017SFG2_ASPRC|nr:uncharacterized protein EURHEDRAFT_455017 [Aspergillus ruber CBS 135680]EYE95687.1 hypothetical protein EURHEDRAFT_455017 [Aspergillus ruber CBS 135680]